MKHPRAVRTAIPLLAAALAACSSGPATSAGPCPGGLDLDGCGDSCTGPGDCPAGLHCGDQDRCTAECTTAGADCGAGRICTSDGRCQESSAATGGDGSACAAVSVTLTPALPTVVLLIDRSGSMNGAISGQDATVRWNAVRKALIDEQSGIVKALERRVIFGASLYSAIRKNDPPPVSEAPCPRMLETPTIALRNFDGVRALLGAHTPSGGTPTEAAIRHVTARFPLAPDGRSPRVLLLATDGEPDTCELEETSDAIKDGVEDAAADAHQLGIDTHVLSVGSDIARTHLQRVANAGLGLPRDTGTAPVYQANTADQLVQAFERIIRGVRSCDLSLQGTLNPSRAAEGEVRMDGTPLRHGSDWELVDTGALRLIGQACADFRTRDAVQLSATFPCGVLVE